MQSAAAHVVRLARRVSNKLEACYLRTDFCSARHCSNVSVRVQESAQSAAIVEVCKQVVKAS